MASLKKESVSEVTKGLQAMHSALDDDGKRVLAALLRQASLGARATEEFRMDLAPDLSFDLMVPGNESW